MSSNQLRVGKISVRARIRKCTECGNPLIRFGGNEYDENEGHAIPFIVGRICKRCKILFISPNYKEHKIIVHKIGDNCEKKDL